MTGFDCSLARSAPAGGAVLGPWMKTGAAKVAAPSCDTATGMRRSLSVLVVSRQADTYTRSPAARGWTPTFGRMKPSEFGRLRLPASSMATTPTPKVRPPSVDLATRTESPWPGRFHENVT